MNGDLICLSSDDEEEPVPKKLKISSSPRKSGEDKPNNSVQKLNDSVICLDSDEDNDSDEDSDSEDVIIVNKENLDTNGTTESPQKKLNDSPNHIEVISFSPSSALNLSNGSSNDKGSDESEGENASGSSSETEYCAEEELSSSKQQTNQSDVQSDASTSKYADILADTGDLPDEALTYLKVCRKMLRDSSAEPIFKKYPVIIKMFRSLSEEFSRTEYLNKFLRKKTKIAKESVSCCIVSFRDVYQHLKDSLNSQSIELPKKHWKHVRKLEKMMQQLLEKLKELEDAEIDFEEEEEDSAYLKHDRYSQRLNQVYKKYCEILKKNPYAGRITYERLDFVSSNYNEINQAISKKYKNNKKFPSYDELHEYIKTVVKENKLPLNSDEVKYESEECFKKLGDLLQIRRKKELYDSHQKYMNVEDPAKGNAELEKRLRISLKEGKVKIEQVCQEYVRKQELGIVGEEDDLSELGDEDESDEENG